MLLWSGAIDAIDIAGISLDEAWVWSSLDVYGTDYDAVLEQPVSLEAIGGLSSLRFRDAYGAGMTTITIRAGNTTTSPFLWAGTVVLKPDPEPSPDDTAGTVTSVDIIPPALMEAIGGPITDAGAITLMWNGSPLDLVLADGSTYALADIVTPPHNSLTGRGVADAHPMSAITGLASMFGSYLPLAAGPSSPLAGTLHGTSLYFSGWTADAPIAVAMNYSSAFAHAITVVNFGLTAGQRLTVDFGQSAYTNNQANFGFVYAGAGSTANKITLGLYGNNDLVTIAGTGVVTVRDLGTGFVRATSGVLSASALAGADLPNSGVTAATYGSATQSAVVVVDAKGRITSASNVTITPAFASITGKPTTLAGYGITDATLQNAYNASTSPQILTTAAKGALVLQAGPLLTELYQVLAIADHTGAQYAHLWSNGTIQSATPLVNNLGPYSFSASGSAPSTHMYNYTIANTEDRNWVTKLTSAGYIVGVVSSAGVFSPAFTATSSAGSVVGVDIGGGYARAQSFVKVGGTSAQFLKADGSVDGNSYATVSSLSNYLSKTAGGVVSGYTAFSNGLAATAGISVTGTAVINAGGQLTVSKDSTPTTSFNTLYAQAPIVVNRVTGSGTATVAGIGFHNNGVNAALLYYDAATSVFKYNRETAGGIVTIWDSSSLSVSGTANQLAFFTGANSVTSDIGLTRSIAGGVTNAVIVGHGTLAAETAFVIQNDGTQDRDINYKFGGTTTWSARTIGVSDNYVIRAHGIDDPVTIVRAGGGAITFSRPLYMPNLSIWGTARGGDGGRWMHYMGGGTGGVGTGTSTALIQRYQYGGFDGFVVGNAEFYGITQDHQYGGPGAQLSIVAGAAVGRISFFAGLPALQASGNYQSPRVGDWTSAGLAVIGTLSATVSVSCGGGVFKAYDAGHLGIYGDNAPGGIGNYSFVAARTGAYSWINGTTSSGLAVGAQGIALATSAGLAVTGTLSATSTLAWGGGSAIGSSANVVQGENSTRTIETAAWTSALPSGFYNSNSAGTTPSGGWCHMIAGRYTNPSNNYQSQIATDFFNDRMWFRRMDNGAATTWRELWHSGNLSSATLPGGPYLPLAGGVVSGSTTFNAGYTTPAGVDNYIGTSRLTYATGQGLGIRGFGTAIGIGRSNTVYLSSQAVSATFNEGLDAIGSSWINNLTLTGTTTFTGVTKPNNSTYSGTSNFTLPVLVVGQEINLFFTGSSCSVFANSTQQVRYRSFAVGDIRTANVSARVDAVGAFGTGSSTSVSVCKLICVDSSTVAMIV